LLANSWLGDRRRRTRDIPCRPRGRPPENIARAVENTLDTICKPESLTVEVIEIQMILFGSSIQATLAVWLQKTTSKGITEKWTWFTKAVPYVLNRI
jgi:hypothetical protein